MVKVSVIIPTLNEGLRLPRCLRSLSLQSFRDFEVLVVDSGSDDGTAEMARDAGARVFYEPKLGVSIAKNFGAEEAAGEIIVFTDADTVHPSSWLRRIMEHFANQKAVCVFGPVKPGESGAVHKVVYAVTTNYMPRIAHAFGFEMAHGSNQAFRKSAFLKAGGYDENLNVLEDNELPNRMRGLGKVVFDPMVWVMSSTRRFKKEGYFSTTSKFLAAYWNIYVKKKRKPVEYARYR